MTAKCESSFRGISWKLKVSTSRHKHNGTKHMQWRMHWRTQFFFPGCAVNLHWTCQSGPVNTSSQRNVKIYPLGESPEIFHWYVAHHGGEYFVSPSGVHIYSGTGVITPGVNILYTPPARSYKTWSHREFFDILLGPCAGRRWPLVLANSDTQVTKKHAETHAETHTLHFYHFHNFVRMITYLNDVIIYLRAYYVFKERKMNPKHTHTHMV